MCTPLYLSTVHISTNTFGSLAFGAQCIIWFFTVMFSLIWCVMYWFKLI